MAQKNYKHPVKEDLVNLYNTFGDNTFTLRDVKNIGINLECNIKRLTDNKTVIKIERTKYNTWRYKINPRFIRVFKCGEIPKLVNYA
jgi:hypothetical protein